MDAPRVHTCRCEMLSIPAPSFVSAALSPPAESAGPGLKAAEWRPSSVKEVCASACTVPCKMFQDELEDLCRREKLCCKDLGVNKSNINDYEVEFLCDYKKTKVSYRSSNNTTALSGSRLLQTLFSFIYLLELRKRVKPFDFVISSQTAVVCSGTYKHEFIS